MRAKFVVATRRTGSVVGGVSLLCFSFISRVITRTRDRRGAAVLSHKFTLYQGRIALNIAKLPGATAAAVSATERKRLRNIVHTCGWLGAPGACRLAAIAVGALRESKQLREPASEQHHPRKIIDEPCGKGDPSGHIWRQRATARVSFQRQPFVDIDVDQR